MPDWREEDGVIYFTVTSDGTTGEAWVTRLEKQDFRLSTGAKSVLRSKEFVPTTGVTYQVAVLKGSLFTNVQRYTQNIRADADRRRLSTPPVEVACLIRERLSDLDLEAMDITWLLTMHEPSEAFDGRPHLLCADRTVGGSWLNMAYDHPDDWWGRVHGFAFLAP